MRAAAVRDEARLARFQAGCAGLVVLERRAAGRAHWIAGVDALSRDGVCVGVVTLHRAGAAEPEEIAIARRPATASYRYGFLAFSELEAIFAAAALLSRPPDLAFYDGNGVLHPRGFGAASQFGLLLGAPTIGVSKNVRAATMRAMPRGHVEIIAPRRGAFLTTSDGVKPIVVSPGHLIDLEGAIEATLAFSRHRVPEPIRTADRATRSAQEAAGPMARSGPDRLGPTSA